MNGLPTLPVTLVASLGFLNGCPAWAQNSTSPPNIIVILADDLGFSDIGCYGGEIPTPNLDKLAAEGIRFIDFHNTSRCCPSRASLLTGLYSHQAGMGGMVSKPGDVNPNPSYQGYLNDSCVTLAEVLDGAGYFTTMAGKWHVGQEHDVTPWSRGFQRSLNSPDGGFYYPESPKADLFLNGKDLGKGEGVLPPHWYTTDLYTDYGLKFIDEAQATKKPFFLYLAYNAPHFPVQAPLDEVAKFRHGIYEKGWDVLREARYERQVKMGIIDKSWDLSPRDDKVQPWDSLTPEQKDTYDTIMSVYAADVAHMDTQIGKLVDGLKKRGVFNNTVIFFLSDNGASAEGLDGAIKAKFGKGKSAVPSGPPGSPTSFLYMGRSWANLGDTPFRLFKMYEQEGGIASPLIVHWPDGIKDRGQLRPQLAHIIDLMPTIAQLGHAQYPATFNGKPILPLEGTSLVPAFANSKQTLSRSQPLFWEHIGNRAINDDTWKLVALKGQPWELYDYKTDRTEVHNLATQHPDVVQKLSAEWDAWAKRVGAALDIHDQNVEASLEKSGANPAD